jgi:hypothetical protein
VLYTRRPIVLLDEAFHPYTHEMVGKLPQPPSKPRSRPQSSRPVTASSFCDYQFNPSRPLCVSLPSLPFGLHTPRALRVATQYGAVKGELMCRLRCPPPLLCIACDSHQSSCVLCCSTARSSPTSSLSRPRPPTASASRPRPASSQPRPPQRPHSALSQHPRPYSAYPAAATVATTTREPLSTPRRERSPSASAEELASARKSFPRAAAATQRAASARAWRGGRDAGGWLGGRRPLSAAEARWMVRAVLLRSTPLPADGPADEEGEWPALTEVKVSMVSLHLHRSGLPYTLPATVHDAELPELTEHDILHPKLVLS